MYPVYRARRNHFPSLLENHSPFSSLLDSFWKDLEEGTKAVMHFAPQLDVEETEKAFLVNVELPGVSKDDIDVSLKDGLLTIKGEKKQESEEKKEGHYRSERSYGSFQRVLKLNENIVVDEIAADFKDGVLKVTLPKAETEPQKRIAIN